SWPEERTGRDDGPGRRSEPLAGASGVTVRPERSASFATRFAFITAETARMIPSRRPTLSPSSRPPVEATAASAAAEPASLWTMTRTLPFGFLSAAASSEDETYVFGPGVAFA